MPKSVKNFLNERLLAIAIFSLAFAVLGQAIPNLYYRYFDFTNGPAHAPRPASSTPAIGDRPASIKDCSIKCINALD